MIRAYDEALFEAAVKDVRLSDFIAETTVAADPESVGRQLRRFLEHERPAQQVQDVLTLLLGDDRLIAKVHLVSDRNWRTCVLAVTPERAAVTQGGITLTDGSSDLEATFSYWRIHAETVFIHLGQSETPAAAERTLGESMEYLLYWLFKRYFGKVAS